MALKPPIGIFGGTFDPIHLGHLRTALEIQQTLNLAHCYLLPCGNPPHRHTPHASGQHRCEMIKCALKSVDAPLSLDTREVDSPELSYTVNTLTAYRRELTDTPICLIIGNDAFLHLTKWHEWERLPELAHLIVVPRPELNRQERTLQQETVFKRIFEPGLLHDVQSGCLYTQPVTPLSISATQLRSEIHRGRNPQFLLPDAVLTYIKEHRLYRGDDTTYD